MAENQLSVSESQQQHNMRYVLVMLPFLTDSMLKLMPAFSPVYSMVYSKHMVIFQ